MVAWKKSVLTLRNAKLELSWRSVLALSSESIMIMLVQILNLKNSFVCMSIVTDLTFDINIAVFKII